MINITESAINKLRLLKKDPGEIGHIRIEVEPGGCAGFKYDLKIDRAIDKNQDIVEQYDDVLLIYNKQIKDIINNCTIDYKDGLMDSGFKITNPNFSHQCGCGDSWG